MDNNKRLSAHQKNSELEFILKTLESTVVDPAQTQSFKSDFPKIFIVGCARSGSTLLTQLLANYTDWCYPTNLMSRFYYAPFTGALIQKMFYDLDERGELYGKQTTDFNNINSTLGKTKGALSPNEFWYFWRRFFKFGEIQKLSNDELDNVDVSYFLNSLHSIQHAFKKPLFMKAMILNWHIDYLHENVPNSFFIYIKRDTIYNAQSLLIAKEKFFGNLDEWYSFKPPEFNQIIKKSPIQQVIEQVKVTNRAIEYQLQKIDATKHISISYEELCAHPVNVFSNIYKMLGYEFKENIPGITNTNHQEVEDSIWKALNQ